MGQGSRSRSGGGNRGGRASHGGNRPGAGSGGPRPVRTDRPAEAPSREPRVIELPDSIALRELGTKINISPINIIREFMQNGMMATINQQLDFDTAAIARQRVWLGSQADPDRGRIGHPR